MARLLTPEDYGITALPAAFYAIAGIFIEGSFGTALIRKEKLSEEDLSTAFLYSSSIGILCFFLLFIGAPWIAVFFNVPILSSLIRVTAIPFLWSGFMTPQSVILNRRLDFKTPAIISVISKFFMGLVGISMAFGDYGVWALVVSSLVSSIITVVLTWFYVRWRPKTGWSRESFKYLWGFGNKMIATLLIDRTYTNIVPLIIGKYYSPSQLGEYNRAQGYAQLPAQQFTSLLHNVSYPVLSKMQDDIGILRSNYRRMLRLCAFVMFPVMIMMAVLAKPLIVLLVTEKWIACVPYLQLMCVAMMWSPIHSINLALLLVKGRSDFFLRLEIIKKTIGFLIMAVSLPYGIIPFLIGTVVHTLLCLFVNTYYTGKIINLGCFMQMWDVIPVLMLTTIMAITTHVTTLISDNYFIQLLVGCIVGSLTYLLGSYIFKFSELKDFKYMLKRDL